MAAAICARAAFRVETNKTLGGRFTTPPASSVTDGDCDASAVAPPPEREFLSFTMSLFVAGFYRLGEVTRRDIGWINQADRGACRRCRRADDITRADS
jgi:hypothetical protein